MTTTDTGSITLAVSELPDVVQQLSRLEPAGDRDLELAVRCLVSGGREPPPPALLEPYVTVSRHTAPTVRRWVEARRCQ